MQEIIYTIDQEVSKEKTFLIVQIQEKNSQVKRHLYRDTLLSIARDKDLLAMKFLIPEHLKNIGISPLSSQADTLPLNRMRFSTTQVKEIFPLLGATGRLFLKGKKMFVDPFTRLEFFIEATHMPESVLKIEGQLESGNERVGMGACEWLFGSDPIWVARNGSLQMLKHSFDLKWIQLVLSGPAFLEGKQRERFLEFFEDKDVLCFPRVTWKNQIEQEEKIKQSWPILQLKDRSGAFADLFLDYGKEGRAALHDLKKMSFRDLQAEKLWEKDLLETGFVKKIVDSSHYYCPLDKVGKSLTFLLEIGWTILDYQGKRVVRQKNAALSLVDELSTIIVKGHVNYENYSADLKEVVGAFNRKEHFISLSSDTVGLIDRETIQDNWGEWVDQEEGQQGIKIKKHHFSLLGNLIESKEIVKEKSLETLLFRPQEEPAYPGKNFYGTLHPYQQEGVNWLNFLYTSRLGGLLADEMGLGKTVQILAFLSRLCPSSLVLIVAPTSLLFNWRKEIERFLPTFSIYVHTGKERLKEVGDLKQKTCILTSYALLRQDIELFQEISFACVILDEAQMIKNPDSQISKCVFRLGAAFRLAVTGTPIENRWNDVWSLFHFVEPGLLEEKEQFQAKMQAAELDGRYLKRLQKTVRPFMLRRTKEDVCLQLPEKIEQIVWIEMGDKQREFYDSFLSRHCKGVIKKVEQGGLSAHRMEVLEAILRLRQICCHPWLVDGSLSEDPFVLSAKLDRVLSDVEEMVSQGRKILIYSQFTQMLHLIEKCVREKGWNYVYLDGSSKDREESVRRFQEEASVSLFLISLKAGGVGLNLTAADYVFLFDPWWNEAVEKQAIDRAHRLGRTNTVIAKRYVTTLSIEEKIMHLKQSKLKLADNLFEWDETLQSLTLDDFYALLQ